MTIQAAGSSPGGIIPTQTISTAEEKDAGAPQVSDGFSKTDTPQSPDEGKIFTRKLKSNPLFADGANFDEFQLTKENADFAQKQFSLEQPFVDMVKAGNLSAKFSVVYHSEAEEIKVDAYRTAAQAGKDCVFTAYDIKNPAFNPGQAYRNELVTPLGGNKAFGTFIVSKRLAVPDGADPSLTEWLTKNRFEKKETIPFGSFAYPKEFKDQFGLKDDLGINMYEMKRLSFADKFKVFYTLAKSDPEYMALKIGDTLADVGSAMVLGVITPKLWTQGTAYGVASTMSSLGNIGSPAVSILGESILGSVVDKAVNSDKPLENLKKVRLYTAGLGSVNVGCYFALNPEIVGLFGPHKAAGFTGIYGVSLLASGISGVMSGKANQAIHDQLINKGAHSTPDIAKSYYQILGVESSISQGVYLGSYTGVVAAASAWPHASLWISGIGAGLWAGSKFIFPLYHEKPEMKTTVEGSSFIHNGNRYIFDSGWEVSFKGVEGKIVKDDDRHFSISFADGGLYMKNNDTSDVSVKHKRRIKDYLPKFMAPKMLGEKEHWELSDGSEKVDVSRYGNAPYRLEKVSGSEYLLTKGETVDDFWT